MQKNASAQNTGKKIKHGKHFYNKNRAILVRLALG